MLGLFGGWGWVRGETRESKEERDTHIHSHAHMQIHTHSSVFTLKRILVFAQQMPSIFIPLFTGTGIYVQLRNSFQLQPGKGMLLTESFFDISFWLYKLFSQHIS